MLDPYLNPKDENNSEEEKLTYNYIQHYTPPDPCKDPNDIYYPRFLVSIYISEEKLWIDYYYSGIDIQTIKPDNEINPEIKYPFPKNLYFSQNIKNSVLIIPPKVIPHLQESIQKILCKEFWKLVKSSQNLPPLQNKPIYDLNYSAIKLTKQTYEQN